MRRTLGLALAGAVLMMLIGLGAVGLRVEQVQLAYRLDALRAERARLEALVRQLEVETATLRSPARLQSRAQELGLGAPSPEQVRLAREYLPGGRGLSARNWLAAEPEPRTPIER